MSHDWSAVSDQIEVPVQHGFDERDTWSLRSFCQAIYQSDVVLDVDQILRRAAPFKAFDDPASRKFEHALHRELKSKRSPHVQYAAFAAMVDQVLDDVAEELVGDGASGAPSD